MASSSMLRLLPSAEQRRQMTDRALQAAGLSLNLLVVACQGDLSQASALIGHVEHGLKQDRIGGASVAQFPQRGGDQDRHRVVVGVFGARRDLARQASLVRA